MRRYESVCSSCGKSQEDMFEWRCDSCGAPFSILNHQPFEKKSVKKNDWSLWRYKECLPQGKAEQVSLGEGCTPLVPIGEPNVLAKLDYVMPTGSYKDRGTSPMVSSILPFVKEGKIKKVTEDSSGNAGASLAAYTAKVGIPCSIFAPKEVVEQKARQIQAYGAKLTKVVGSRLSVSETAIDAAKNGLYLSHIWNPYFSDGIRTLAYEIAEALSWEAPDYIFLPVSAGTLLLGVIRGFTHLRLSGVTDKIPKIIACQALLVSPLYHAWRGERYIPPSKVSSVADALITTKPARLNEMISELKKSSGDVEVVDEAEIKAAAKTLALRGLYVEPSAAVSYAAWKKQSKLRRLGDGKAVLILTGTGLKSPTNHQF
ncbi:MAG: pyridoxal-phosphate dependent enzyme [Thaumarchaeota archaeon]|nr:pyridoxal-phosphate dependent enzyme [Nitrososphaerota archaeon]